MASTSTIEGGSTPGLDTATAVAGALAGATVLSLERLGGGRNSRVFRVDTASGRYALKQYPSRTMDNRDRLGTEIAALAMMRAHGFDTVPRVIAADREQNFALLTWAEGDLVRDVSAADVEQALSFLSHLHALRETAAFPQTCLATEACLSGAEIQRQIAARVSNLRALHGEDDLVAFLDHEFAEVFRTQLELGKSLLAEAGIAFDRELPQTRRSLVPSDFGFHNALRRHDGTLTFIDFEYFGWDDPVKLTSDILHHPGTPVTPALKQRLQEGAETLYGDDPDFALRLSAFLPLFGLRWALILLNEFHPERWRTRVAAGALQDWGAAKARQLSAARTLLAEIASRGDTH